MNKIIKDPPPSIPEIAKLFKCEEEHVLYHVHYLLDEIKKLKYLNNFYKTQLTSSVKEKLEITKFYKNITRKDYLQFDKNYISKYGLVKACASCQRIKSKKGKWVLIAEALGKIIKFRVSHGICPKCIEKTNWLSNKQKKV